MNAAPQTAAATRQKRSRARKGVSVVELAVCMPMLFALVFGVIEVSNAIFLQQALTSAAYEAANVASANGGTSASAQTRAKAVLTSLGIHSSTVTITPTVTASTSTGTEIVITCSAPLANNLVAFGFMGGPTLSARITIPRV